MDRERELTAIFVNQNEFTDFDSFVETVEEAKWAVMPHFAKNWTDTLCNCRENGVGYYSENVIYAVYVTLGGIAE